MGFCVRCGERWTGMSKCHCTGCHRMFKSAAAFDRHRRGLKCVDPEDCGMTMKDGIWANWMTEEEKADFRAAHGKQNAPPCPSRARRRRYFRKVGVG